MLDRFVEELIQLFRTSSDVVVSAVSSHPVVAFVFLAFWCWFWLIVAKEFLSLRRRRGHLCGSRQRAPGTRGLTPQR